MIKGAGGFQRLSPGKIVAPQTADMRVVADLMEGMQLLKVGRNLKEAIVGEFM
jgi:hypothetical protein